MVISSTRQNYKKYGVPSIKFFYNKIVIMSVFMCFIRDNNCKFVEGKRETRLYNIPVK